ncbi:MAG: hypothetical protein HYX84_02760 [Chloroflexi bacterium]|nr:hypothetical protein [Chloroflexota bacterium]
MPGRRTHSVEKMEVIFALRAIAGSVFFLLPGFVWSYAFFRKSDLTLLERAAIGSGLSISSSTIILLAANKLLDMPLNLATVSIVLGMLSITGLAVLAAMAVSSRGKETSPTTTDPLRHADVPEYLVLAAILAFAFFLAYIPHLNYVYPLHIDEWEHFALSQSLVDAQTIDFTDPLIGEKRITTHPEIGFHLFLTQIKLLTGLSWITIFRFFPALLFAVTGAAAYLFGRRSGFGLEAAFFTAFIPTTVRMLGPSFLVPVALSLPLLPLVLFLLHYFYENKASTIFVLLLLLAFVFVNHPPSAAVVSLAVVVYGGMQWLEHWREPRYWLKLALVIGGIAIAFFILYLRFPAQVVDSFRELAQPKTPPYGLIMDALPKFGYVSLALFLAGVGFLTYRWRSRERNLVILAGVYIGVVGIFHSLTLGVTIVADRAWLFLLLTAAIIAGFAAHRILATVFEYQSRFPAGVMIGAMTVTAVLLILSGSFAVRQRFDEPYYHLVTKDSYEDMVWIKQNVSSEHRRAVVDPSFGLAFAPLAGRSVYVGESVQVFNGRRLREANDFLSAGAADTKWMKERGIDMVYTWRPVNNPDLVKVRERVYLLHK